VEQNPELAIGSIVLLSVLILLFARLIIARGLIRLASRTSTKTDDILVKYLRPLRIAWMAPLVLFFAAASLLPDYEAIIQKVALFFILWLAALTVIGLLNALNEIYERRPSFNGVSIQSYLDIAKLGIVGVAIILSISLISGESPMILLTGLGALAAVLLLIFQNTILSLVASVQIAANDLIKEGDWIEVPSYEADGDVININLHTIKIQNFDKTITVIPTYKIVDVAYRNWRGMQESGGRRIQRSLSIDMTSVKFCNDEMLDRLVRIDLLNEKLTRRIAGIREFQKEKAAVIDSPLDGPQITNLEVFRMYIECYLRKRKDVHQKDMPFLVHSLEPTSSGLPIELYVFARTTSWEEYEGIQSEILDHLLAAAGHFDLRVFQQPTGRDFASLNQALVEA
jgi:miniconductance mechanosensitive channel